jgi:hypothetical protein
MTCESLIRHTKAEMMEGFPFGCLNGDAWLVAFQYSSSTSAGRSTSNLRRYSLMPCPQYDEPHLLFLAAAAVSAEVCGNESVLYNKDPERAFP